MKKITGMNKKYKWMLLLASLFLVVAGMFAYARKDKTYAADQVEIIVTGKNGNIELGSDYTMRRADEEFTAIAKGIGVPWYEWHIYDGSILEFDSSKGTVTDPTNTTTTVASPSGRYASVKLKDIGSTPMDLIVYDGDPTNGGEVVGTFNFTVNTRFSISDDTKGTVYDAYFNKIFEEDERKALILTYKNGSGILLGDDKSLDTSKLNLNFGSAQKAEWSSSNTDIIQYSSAGQSISINGAGHAKLTASYNDGVVNYSDTIDVYVRPELTITKNPDDMENGDSVKVSIRDNDNPIITASDKLIWVITKKGEDGKAVLVSDSLGNGGDFKDDAKLEPPEGDTYKLNAKAGVYNIAFYVAGTYRGWEDMIGTDGFDPNLPGCNPVYIGADIGSPTVKVKSNFSNKEVAMNVNDTYSIPNALNIAERDLRTYFDINIEPASLSGISAYDIVDHDKNTNVVKAKDMGAVIITITRNGKSGFDIDKNLTQGKSITIRLSISEVFNLNISEAKMQVGSTENLYGMFASGVTRGGTYEWKAQDINGNDVEDNYIQIERSGRQAKITALKKTDAAIKVLLSWTSTDGLTLTAVCNITIGEAVTDFSIKHEKTMKVGSKQYLSTSITGETVGAKIVWFVSDTKLATITDLSGNSPAAEITALAPGPVVVTAFNTSNNTYATCVITINQPIEDLQIGIDNVASSTYETVLSKGFIFMQPIYKPENATTEEFTWSSSKEDVATVDNTGKVTILKEGETLIRVKAEDENGKFGECALSIVRNPITDIVTDVSELYMVKGDTYTVTTEIAPIDPSDKTLIWSSDDESIAKVDNNGKITAVGVGNPGGTPATITVEAAVGDADGGKIRRTIKVYVREKLEDVKFESNDTYINVGASKNVGLIYTPAENINKNVEFASSNTSIFTVEKDKDNNCTIKGVAVGTAILSCVSEDLGAGKVATCTVHVTATAVPATDFAITPADATVDIGKTLQLEKIFTPKDATNQYVTWSSSDTAIATVNNVGTVTGVKEGKITISAVYTDTPDRVPWIRTSTITVKDAPIRATSFDVDPATKNIIVGEKFNITPIFTPDNTTNKHVDYQSLDTGVVTVDDKGVVTGVGAGDAVIQCQSEDGGFIATCAVRVDNAIEFSLSPATKEIAVGKSFKLKKVTKPADANKTATWSTSNASIASVSASGRVTGKRIGSCVISCTITKYNQSARCRVKVAKLNSKVKFDNKNIRIGVGQTHRLKTTVWTNNSSKPKLNWKSANSSVASVNSGGKITGKRVGLTKITATTNDSVRAKATCKVRVIQRISSLSLNTDYAVVYVGRTKKLTAKIKPANTTIKKVKWASGDDNIARVTGSGKIRGIAEGNTYITATATDGSNKKARCYVKVLDAVPATSIVVAQTDLTMERGDSAKLTYKVLPNDTSDNIEFASDNKRVATVNNKGNVRAVGTGNATITILASSGVSSTVDVNVVALNKTSLNMRQYDTETLTVIGTSDPITWYTANARIATVENGKVTGRAEGITYIYAYVNGCRLSCRVTITSVSD